MNSVLLSPTPTAGPRPGRPDWRVDELWPKYIQSVNQSVTRYPVPGSPVLHYNTSTGYPTSKRAFTGVRDADHSGP